MQRAKGKQGTQRSITPLKTTEVFLGKGRIDDGEVGTRYLLDAGGSFC